MDFKLSRQNCWLSASCPSRRCGNRWSLACIRIFSGVTFWMMLKVRFCPLFINRNQEAINSLQAAATRLDQQWLLYLCILMHIQGKQRLMTPETRDFILSLLEKQVFHDTSQKHITYSRRLCLIRGVPYHLNSGGQLVTLKGNVIHPLAKNAPTLVGVAWTERLGILGLCSDGKVIQRGICLNGQTLNTSMLE